MPRNGAETIHFFRPINSVKESSGALNDKGGALPVVLFFLIGI